MPLAPEVSSALVDAGLSQLLPPEPAHGKQHDPGTLNTNSKQQDYFANAATKVILPMFKKSGKPFAMLYWSRDPDGTQHFQGDSLNRLIPGN